MELLDTILRVNECADPSCGFRVLVEALVHRGLLDAAFWSCDDGSAGGEWPEGDSLAGELRAAVTEGRQPSAPGLLVLPLRRSGAVLGLLRPEPAPAGEPELEHLARSFDQLLSHHRRLAEAQAERDAFRLRAEQSEALHTMGLAANRSLDPDEVLDLVARFSRTLLGAHYVTVTVSDHGRISTVAAVGTRTAIGEHGDPLAGRVIEARLPLRLDEDANPGSVERLPLHRAEGMRTGLGVPLTFLGETVGALVVGYRRPYRIEPRDMRLALALGGHAAVAISNARLHFALAARSRELEAAYAELRWSAEAKERFFASMSHELRTPLNAILGYQSLLTEGIAGPLSPRQQDFVENASRATRNLLRLVNDVLDLSKLDAGKIEVVIRPTDLRELVAETLTTVRPLAEAKGLRLVGPPPSPVPRIRTDSERVEQILLNLLSNAIKFTEEGEVGLSAEADDGWISLRVSDTGPGIHPGDRERIFREFEQVVDAASRGGTGLGLSISRKLARLLGGDLEVESEPGRGAVFILRLPVERTDGGGIPLADAGDSIPDSSESPPGTPEA